MLWIAALPLPILYACFIYTGVLFALVLIIVAFSPQAANRIFRLLDEIYRLRYGNNDYNKQSHHRSNRRTRNSSKKV